MDDKSNVRSYYNQYASNYDNFYQPIQFQKYESIPHVLSEINPWVVDLGGGSGLLAKWLNCYLVNFDLSYNMLLEGLKERKYLAVACDLHYLPLRKQSISTIFSFTALQNCQNTRKALHEIQRISCLNTSGLISILRKSSKCGQIKKELYSLPFLIQQITTGTEDMQFVIQYNGSSISSGSKSS